MGSSNKAKNQRAKMNRETGSWCNMVMSKVRRAEDTELMQTGGKIDGEANEDMKTCEKCVEKVVKGMVR